MSIGGMGSGRLEHGVDEKGDGYECICHHLRPKPAFGTIKVTVLVISVTISVPMDYRACRAAKKTQKQKYCRHDAFQT